MKEPRGLVFFLIARFVSPVLSQEKTQQDLQKGFNFIETKVHSDAENNRILKLYEGLRVADVSDGIDMAGLPGVGLVDPAIHPSWIDEKDLSHQFRGVAITARYVPNQRQDRPAAGEKFHEWEGNFYNAYSSEAFTKLIRPGTVVVLDDVEEKDIGSIGSYSILFWKSLGAVGVRRTLRQETPMRSPWRESRYACARKVAAYAREGMNWNP
jgi:4-hydroxy-4-methyl-2-oxoglutarate aldolase